MCINDGGDAKLSSRTAAGRSRPNQPATGPKLVAGNTEIFTEVIDGIATCVFSRTLNVPSGSEQFMYDLNTNRYIAWAVGPVVNGLPNIHTNRAISGDRIDIKEFQVTVLIIFLPEEVSNENVLVFCKVTARLH